MWKNLTEDYALAKNISVLCLNKLDLYFFNEYDNYLRILFLFQKNNLNNLIVALHRLTVDSDHKLE
jgi:hypothetical protein